MSEDRNEGHLPDTPEKLAERIEELPDHLKAGEAIVSDGEIALKSEHPVSVVEYFLAVHVDEWADWTYKDYSYDLTRFLEYSEHADLDDLSELSSRDLEGFKQWRKRDDTVGLASLHGQLGNIRVFLRWCETMEIIADNLANEIDMPTSIPQISSPILASKRRQQHKSSSITGNWTTFLGNSQNSR